MTRFAVIDIESTGFGKKDSILEIGIVLLDDDEIVLEWETLINPNRDISNSNIHGIGAKHLSTAPFFKDVSNDIASLVSERVLVAHNLPFDQRMLMNEFDKLKIEADPGHGICTYNATKMKLEVACEKYGIRNLESHRALADARATALLLARAEINKENVKQAQIPYVAGKPFSRTISRNAFESAKQKSSSRIRRIMHTLDVPAGNSAQMSYMDALTSALSDLHLDAIEKESLKEWADYLGLTSSEIENAHSEYLTNFIEAAKRDGIITVDESEQIRALSHLLSVEPASDINQSSQSLSKVQLSKGLRVCFTGSARDNKGNEITRESLERLAIERGLVPVDSVSKKSCDLVIAADINSMSSKAKKAKEWGISLISVGEFLDQI